jgi:hypothetical protein
MAPALERRTIRMSVVGEDRSDELIRRARPAPEFSRRGDYHVCGNCGTLLVVAEPEQNEGMIAQCLVCESFNKAIESA